MSDAKYTTKSSVDGMGTSFAFFGPGLPKYANSVHFIQPLIPFAQENLRNDHVHGTYEAEQLCRWLAAAFEAGRAAKAKELREVLGVK